MTRMGALCANASNALVSVTHYSFQYSAKLYNSANIVGETALGT